MYGMMVKYGCGPACGCGPKPGRKVQQSVQSQGAMSPMAAGDWAPAIDVKEDAQAFYLSADLPGMSREDIKLDDLLQLQRLIRKMTRPKGTAWVQAGHSKLPTRAWRC